MNKEERVKLVFETISKIAGFEIKPETKFYMIGNGIDGVYLISQNLNLYYKTPTGKYNMSENTISAILNGYYEFKEIKEPLVTEEGKDFLRQFMFEALSVSDFLYLYSRSTKQTVSAVIGLNNINVSFDRLEKDKIYSRKELGL